MGFEFRDLGFHAQASPSFALSLSPTFRDNSSDVASQAPQMIGSGKSIICTHYIPPVMPHFDSCSESDFDLSCSEPASLPHPHVARSFSGANGKAEESEAAQLCKLATSSSTVLTTLATAGSTAP